MAVGIALLLLAPIAHSDDTDHASVFEADLNFGTVCRFRTLSWTSDATTTSAISVTTGTVGVPTFGGFWGRRFTDPEPVNNGDQIPAPTGRSLKLTLTVRGPGKVEISPPVDLSIQYQPLTAPDGAWQRFDVDPSRVAPGKNITWTATIETADDAPPGPHVMRVQIRGPDGKPKRVHTVNTVAADGVARGRVPFALNDVPGTWHVEVTDVISGRQSTHSFVVESWRN